MIVTKDIWLTLTPEKRIEQIAEALQQLKEIDTKNSKLKTKIDQGRLANVKKDLEHFVISAISWESDRQLQRHY
jgi:hypothetical protein